MNRFACLLTLMLTASGFAHAQAGKFELGLALGSPTGVSAKYWTGEHFAIDASLGYHFRSQSHLLLSADFLGHPLSCPFDEDLIKLFAGAGLGLGYTSNLGLSLRIPVGATHYFSHLPLAMWAELVPSIQITGPDKRFWLCAYLGLRYCF